MPGRHTAEFPKPDFDQKPADPKPTFDKPAPRHARSGPLLPLASAAVATVILAGGAYSVSQMSFEPDGQATLAIDREPGHVSRNLQRDAAPSPSASASPTAIPTPSVTPTPSPTKAVVKPSPTPKSRVVSSGSCEASFYDEPQGTANGEVFDPTAMTAAHKTLKFNSRVRVTNIANGKSVIVRINDRGPYIDGRCLDLSSAAFAKIASLGAGHAEVRYEVLG
ncbi:rare lipoprotein A [Allocatelliglobosispora scoriae]|uniref:Probable endolytic peptidoglycan transglycosylase RlpA n=1 Tax=Allocatelliglobosispora scoriae TaxID=643052 RepID=A0A841C225_9ACTN|nr:septal ring lytic transglycosylase RlpA family protein [Allocatelliglobosispora scoriae]MBB5873936.1 rare lipoprotein A [Allocatelliglobosispora scoriae]